MPMVNHEIKKARALGGIVIEPFREEQLNTVSYDVSLGQWVYRFVHPRRGNGFAENVDLPLDSSRFRLSKLGGDGLRLAAGERVLAHTQEFIGGRVYPRTVRKTAVQPGYGLPYEEVIVKEDFAAVTTEMRARSSTARWGLEVCSCAGVGDVGFTGRWTLELYNKNPFPVRIPVGALIGQVVFHAVAVPEGDTYETAGHYAAGFEWCPADMLPKPIRSAPVVRG